MNRKILVLVDFSTPSMNAAYYAAGLALDQGFQEIGLMSNCFVPLFEQIVPSPDMIQVGAADIRGRLEKTRNHLLDLKFHLEKRLPENFVIRTIVGDQPLLRAVLDQVAKEAPSLVIIGASSRTITEDCSVGRQIIPLAKLMPVPVLVIPPDARFHPVKSVLVAGTTQPRELLHPLFGELEIQPYAPGNRNVIEEVLKAAADRNVQMIVALPRKHSFFYALTHQNIMHGIVLNATEPVLILK
jgi:hypothetical protein